MKIIIDDPTIAPNQVGLLETKIDTIINGFGNTLNLSNLFYVKVVEYDMISRACVNYVANGFPEMAMFIKPDTALFLLGANQNKIDDTIQCIHHEAGHIDDNSKRFNHWLISEKTDIHNFDKRKKLADTFWIEYNANFLSGSSITSYVETAVVMDFVNTMNDMNKVIQSMKTTEEKICHISELISRTAHLQGYFGGKSQTFQTYNNKAYSFYLKGKYFEKTWNALEAETLKLRWTYPNWTFDIYDDLETIIIDLCLTLGV